MSGQGERRACVPRLRVEGVGSFEVPDGKRLVLAIEEDAGVDILHRCGSYAKCTTCRIQYLEGEPEKMTKAELKVLKKRGLLGQARLSCQALCDRDMKVRVLMTVTSTGDGIPGGKPEAEITPPPEWVEKPVQKTLLADHRRERIRNERSIQKGFESAFHSVSRLRAWGAAAPNGRGATPVAACSMAPC